MLPVQNVLLMKTLAAQTFCGGQGEQPGHPVVWSPRWLREPVFEEGAVVVCGQVQPKERPGQQRKGPLRSRSRGRQCGWREQRLCCAGRGRACIFHPDSAPIQPSALSKRKQKEMLPRPFPQGKGASLILGLSLSWGQIIIA